MPIKLPKGFQRRKSSGNVLDEFRATPGAGESSSSFRVLERPGSQGKLFDGGAQMRIVSSGSPIPPPKDHYGHAEVYRSGANRPDANNRGSGGTERSQSTAPYDSGASSARLSTSSTNPSSADARSDKNVQGAGNRPFHDIPVPPTATARPGFLRGPSKTFSFGGIRGGRGSPSSLEVELPPPVDSRRNRTVTESTASTATPPRLFDSDLALEQTELEGFGNMFDHIGSSPDPVPVRLIQDEVTSSPTSSYPPTAYPGTNALRVSRAPPPRPISTARSPMIESSPYSWTSQNSHDGLIRSPSPSKTVVQGSPLKNRELSPPPPERYGSMSDTSTAVPPRRPVQQWGPTKGENLLPPPLSPSKSRESNPASEHSASFDPIMAENAQLASMYQESKDAPPRPASNNKVMTPAQWERYKQQKEMDRRLGALSDDSGSDVGDNSDDDDELERSKQAAQQRRKQEAHLSVYRQKMMKVTGETTPNRSGSSLSILRPGEMGSTDVNRMSRMTLDSKNSGKSSSEEDEDEDVPLGILAAHGFPNRNRPPTRLTQSSSNPNLRSVSQTQGAPSVKGGGNLPVFARQLPPDPYYGASLVNSANREQLALHPSAVPIGAGPSTAHPIHPSGLVGVIAGEERARAARRGSPNASGNYDMPPGMVRSQTTGALPGPGYGPGMPPMLTPGDQAQIQMAHQMNQMMQMQMQWMQQMSQSMGGQMNPAMMNMPQYPGQPIPTGSRPQSTYMQTLPGPPAGQRTMSTLNAGMAQWNSSTPILPSINVNGNYAPSIAPSERSNIGLASRYRPVSIAPEPEMGLNHRASTFTSSTVRPWSTVDTTPRPPHHGPRQSVNTVGRRSPLALGEDEDDEQGWAEMKMKKDKKQKGWALRKGQNALQELYNPAS